MSAPITLTGRLGADPELRYTNSGTAVTKLRAVTSSRKRQDDGTWIDTDTTWWHITAFKTLAETVANNLVKGDAIIIIGTVKGREWEDQQTGEKRTALEILADHIGPDYARPRKNASTSPHSHTGSTTAADDPWATQTDEAPF